ncbi:MAG TPA: type II toxin-antitoxin system HicA family toxin [Bacilli bacterium]|nr:type II toxin-antitoxin system HicA family toxin [Bacilli bacterium]
MPNWRDLRRFCEKDEWELYKATDHYYYRKRRPDGTMKYTMVSRGTGEIKKYLWQDILKKQLEVTQAYFNKKS